MEYARALDAAVVDPTVGEPEASPYIALERDKPVNVAKVPLRSPFRYPGGKTWLVPYIRQWLQRLPKKPAFFVEPFAGGGIVALTVAFERLAEHTFIAETEPGVRAVWMTVLSGQGEWLAKRILNFEVTEKNVRDLIERDAEGDLGFREKAFATIVRNRVQRGGILAPGAGLVKIGENGKGLKSRWYPTTLAKRIREIDSIRSRLSFYPDDGFSLMREFPEEESTAVFLDPPYTRAARRLYSHWEVDHARLFELAAALRGDFLLTYDDCEEIAALAKANDFVTKRIAMKNTHHARKNELLIGRDLDWLPQ